MKNFTYFFFVFALIYTSCSISPEPIAYGSDGCHFCSMTIVDKQYAAQYVTKKGKSFKFDAAECMLNQLKSIDENSVALFLVSDYENPGELIDATNATYLISQNLPSPMGAYLSSFENRGLAENVQKVNPGELFTWEGIHMKFDKKDKK
ncbi:nitrous oxide reductase accessory protein NosL [Cellulophaga sp. Hel_I_12]|uniref:nitrous oxide reductase accessory protein NosL n=1 Tax=Cellulophaga sp. Hel_I_12 TaxID=1249972 RepID=UPI000646EAFD|nr:nitrous oxide reductase accessory protein NosL [Cellulophaga sp. Hel_I_12]